MSERAGLWQSRGRQQRDLAEPLRDLAREWPLVVFTVGLQLSAGLALAATLADFKANLPHPESLRPLGLSVFPVLALALLSSLMHLGRPLAAWRSLANLRRSRVSQEILLATGFGVAALAYSLMWWGGHAGMRQATGIATVTLGFAAVVASARVYVIPAQAAWNSGWVPLSFVGATCLLGGVAGGGLVPEIAALRALALTGVLMTAIAASWMMTRTSRTTACRWLWSGTSVALSALAFALISLPAPAFALAVAGVAVGRMLMFSAGNAEPS